MEPPIIMSANICIGLGGGGGARVYLNEQRTQDYIIAQFPAVWRS